MKTILTFFIFLISPFTSADLHGEEWAKDIPIGSEFPSINARDQWGKNWNNQKPPGKKGYVIFFNRSATW